MKPLRTAVLVLAIAATATGASAQGNPSPGTGPMGSMPMHHPMGGMMGHQPGQQAAIPTEPGQAAFGAIQEIVGKLQADPQTDWSKVDVDALRQHLIDMDEVTMRAAAQREPIDNGLRIKVTGSDRTLEAIQRMVPEHARDIRRNEWLDGADNGASEWCRTDGHHQQPRRCAEDPCIRLHGHHGARWSSSDASSRYGQGRANAHALTFRAGAPLAKVRATVDYMGRALL